MEQPCDLLNVKPTTQKSLTNQISLLNKLANKKTELGNLSLVINLANNGAILTKLGNSSLRNNKKKTYLFKLNSQS